jgi:hypothetical protein
VEQANRSFTLFFLTPHCALQPIHPAGQQAAFQEGERDKAAQRGAGQHIAQKVCAGLDALAADQHGEQRKQPVAAGIEPDQSGRETNRRRGVRGRKTLPDAASRGSGKPSSEGGPNVAK